MQRKLSIQAVKKKYEMQFMQVSGVVGVGLTEKKGKEVIVVYVSRKTDAVKKDIPKSVEGCAIHIEVTGEFSAL